MKERRSERPKEDKEGKLLKSNLGSSLGTDALKEI
jgi:hypothetical protein